MSVTMRVEPGSHGPTIGTRLALWTSELFGVRLWEKDPTLWFTEPQPELEDRLGWLNLPARMGSIIPRLESFGAEIAAAKTSQVVVLGMGGSSLAPEVYQAVCGGRAGYPELLVLDSTHPEAVRSVEDRISLETSLFVVSSKSGTTLETLSFFQYFWERIGSVGGKPGASFVAVTDPGSPLEELATKRDFRHVYNAPPDVGGRYSALTEFGLVPAAAIGMDLYRLRMGALDAATRCGSAVKPGENPALVLGAMLGELANAGLNKATLLASARLRPLLAWIEQLIAESTGKEGRGIVPITRDDDANGLGPDRVFVLIDEPDDSLAERAEVLLAEGRPLARLTLDHAGDLGGLMFILEMAVAAAGSILEINPFNQSNVQLAKELARRAVDGDLDTSDVEAVEIGDPELPARVETWLRDIAPPDYTGIHAYLPPTDATREAFEAARTSIRDGRGVATTFDFGPRFLHSTGQLHKGGPVGGRFLQVVDRTETPLAIPETGYDFGSLISAQALGDHQALLDNGRPVLLVDLGTTGSDGLARLLKTIASIATE